MRESADAEVADEPAIIAEWLERCRTGGIRLVQGRVARFVPWADLLADVRTLVAHLERQGVTRGMRIGIRSENTYEWVVLDIALAVMGVVAVAFPVSELRGDSNSALAARYALSALYAAEAVCDRVEPSHVGKLDRLRELEPVEPIVPVNGSDHEQAFTLVFSSGTAGKLKCVRVGWTGCRHLIEATVDAYALTRDDRILVALPLSTFQQRYLTYLAIRSDCEVILARTEQFVPALASGAPTIMLGPPSFYEMAETRFSNLAGVRRRLTGAASLSASAVPWRLIRDRIRRALFAPTHRFYGGSIRLMLVGSAPVRPSTLRFFERAGLPLYQIYGMLETGFVSWNTPSANRVGSVGRPVYPGTVHCDDDGEVVIRHPWHLCLGYTHDSRVNGDGVFRDSDVIATGDLGEFDSDGFLYLRGRKNNVLISRGGAKIQLEELEASLCMATDVNRVAVIERSTEPGLALVAWCRGDPHGARPSLETAVRSANTRLPLGLQIRWAVLLTGEPEPGSVLLNRNMKLNRAAIERELSDRFELMPS